MEVPTWCGKWVVGMDAYKEGVVGAKSKNLSGQFALPLHVAHPGVLNDHLRYMYMFLHCMQLGGSVIQAAFESWSGVQPMRLHV